MVSQRESRRGSRIPLILLGALIASSCSRSAEIEQAPEPGEVPVMEIPRPEGGVPVVEDAELSGSEACNDRPRQQACGGANDFGCDFDGWLRTLAEACQLQTDCRTNGWVEVVVGEEGCATELRMEDPNPAYVSCLTEQLRQYQCPCQNVLGSRFLGLSHDGCSQSSCGTGELRCPPGSTCRDGECQMDD